MILEAAIGDAYGAAFEYTDAAFIAANHDMRHYHKHPKHALGLGRYTDDTEMTTAVAEAMLEGELTRERLAYWFVTAFQRERRVGYARSFYNFLCMMKDGAEFLEWVVPQSDKSGAAMRGWVLGLYETPTAVLHMARLQAMLTHDTPGGIASAQAAAMLTHFFAHQLGAHHEVDRYVLDHVAGPWTEPFSGPVGSTGLESVHAAIHLVTQCDDMATLLQRCIALGGDVDTVATIALGSAALATDVVSNLPSVLVDQLENGPWGQAYLRGLDDRLRERFLPSLDNRQ